MATFLAMDELKTEDFAIRCIIYLKNQTKIQQFGINYNLFEVIYNEFKMTLTVVDFQMLNSLFFWKKAKQNYLTYVGINPRNPMSTTFSPIDGSYFPSELTSCHSKL